LTADSRLSPIKPKGKQMDKKTYYAGLDALATGKGGAHE
jgi:hypothetical protein